MTTRIKKNKGSFKTRTIDIGIGVHKLSWRISAAADGEVVMTFTVSKFPFPVTRSGPGRLSFIGAYNMHNC